MRLDDFCAALERKIPPLEGCEDFDGVAFLPDPGRKVSRVALALDANQTTARAAVDAGADILLTHHPMLYGGEPEKGSPRYLARELLLAHGVGAMSLHARLDAAQGGMNDTLCGVLGIFDPASIVPFGIPGEDGLGRVGTLLPEFCSEGRTVAAEVKKSLNAPRVVITCPDKIIRRAAVVSGSCSDFVPAASALGADAIIGGEFKYHTLDLAVSLGICCIGAGHYYTERHAPRVLMSLISEVAPEVHAVTIDPGCPACVI